MTKQKHKFIEKTWISFFFENKKCIGRTIIINNKELVATISEKGEVGHIPFIDIENPAILNIIKTLPKDNKQQIKILDDEIIKTMCFQMGEA